ncbi:MATE family efflux transporter [Marinilactibacillus sp. XAAS-LB27]|uniref:MATE family efflux transporter n=1 Tax=Marinilactibacillus sp. XAAS-LB27 TaxID=3114538 RepID=UPI002E16C6CD|nr:MATE family efflux transporter [Marinilactibacillus sp. XAAS-LB27]
MNKINDLGKKYTFISLVSYAMPTIIMMIFTAIYTMVDGLFVSRFINTTALSAINIFSPIYGVIWAVALMFGTGANAIIARQLGQKKTLEARKNFSLIIIASMVVGILLTIFGLLLLRPLFSVLGADESEALQEFTTIYGGIIIAFVPFTFLQILFQNFFVTEGKPHFNLIITIIGGIANIVLDYLFIVPFKMGIAGAALATGIGMFIPAIIGVWYFSRPERSNLKFVKPDLDWTFLIRTSINGSSEMISNMAASVTIFALNLLMLQYYGVDGVAAITVINYILMLLTAIFMGYSAGIAPIISYSYGDENHKQLQNIVKYSFGFILIVSIATFSASFVFSTSLISFMISPGSRAFNIALEGFRTFRIAFVFIGFNIFSSMLFTALSNGKISGIISFLRTFGLVLIGFLILPEMIGEIGIWVTIPLAEFISILISIYFIVRKNAVYNYLPSFRK